MTKFDFNVKINQINCIIKQNENLKIIMEVDAKAEKKRSPLQSKQHAACYYNNTMKNLNVNLEESANYLIQLFYQTGKRYSCTRTKIGKLLSIVAFSYARKDQNLFSESIYKYNDCGTAIKDLQAYVDRDVYRQYKYEDISQPILLEPTIESSTLLDIPQKHRPIDNLPEEVKSEIKKVFCTFGSYSPYELGQCINPIIELEGMIDETGKVDLSKLYILNSDDFENSETPTPLVAFLFS